jgi:NAD(P)-dependent dehydrogenase (short-subunit alcohol dehydrogenase family)
MADFTGAGQGIGFHFVKALLESGHRHRAAVLDLRADEFKGLHGEKLLLLDCDVRSAEQVEKCVGEAAAAFGRIDCAVHNACVCTFDGFMQSDEETFRDVFDVNYYGALRLTKAVLPVMLKQGGGER